MLKLTWAAGLLATGLLALAAAPAAAADAKGEWTRPDGGAKIRIASCGKALCGTLVWLRNPRNDTENPNASLRSRPLLGVEVVKSMTPTNKAGKWSGQVYNAEDGKTYKGSIQLTSANSLKLEGCVMGGLVCRGETWTRSR